MTKAACSQNEPPAAATSRGPPPRPTGEEGTKGEYDDDACRTGKRFRLNPDANEFVPQNITVGGKAAEEEANGCVAEGHILAVFVPTWAARNSGGVSAHAELFSEPQNGSIPAVSVPTLTVGNSRRVSGHAERLSERAERPAGRAAP